MVLSFIFYCKKWSGKRGSNSRPRPWQGRALPTELFPHLSYFKMVPEARLELARPERRGILNPLRLPIPPLGHILKWSGKRGSNSRPRPWQGRALPTELFPHLSYFKMVPEARLELARPERRGILNPLRLPIPPLGQLFIASFSKTE